MIRKIFLLHIFTQLKCKSLCCIECSFIRLVSRMSLQTHHKMIEITFFFALDRAKKTKKPLEASAEMRKAAAKSVSHFSFMNFRNIFFHFQKSFQSFFISSYNFKHFHGLWAEMRNRSWCKMWSGGVEYYCTGSGSMKSQHECQNELWTFNFYPQN